MANFSAPERLAHLTPIECPHCGGAAHMVRRTPDAFKRDGKTEHWTYECAGCGKRTEQTVET